ncbi:MAG: hypothetical protein E7052_02000 [Lentisphaerae bacterium]|nr:hypothetical protein [Lentisphaerota bacterium]
MQGAVYLNTTVSCPVNPVWKTRFKTYAFADDISEELRNAFLDAEGLLAQSELIKNSRSTTAGIFVVNDQRFFIKRSNVGRLSERIRRIGRMPRSVRNMRMAGELEKLGIYTPKVYMALATGAWFLPAASYLITEYIPGSMTFRDNLSEIIASPLQWQDAVQQLSAIVLKMHDNGIEHGDLKLCNLMAVRQIDGTFRFGVFDLDGCVKHSSACSDRVRARELSRVVSSSWLSWPQKDPALPRPEVVSLARQWCDAYSQCGGKNYYTDANFRKKLADFLPDVHF